MKTPAAPTHSGSTLKKVRNGAGIALLALVVTFGLVWIFSPEIKELKERSKTAQKNQQDVNGGNTSSSSYTLPPLAPMVFEISGDESEVKDMPIGYNIAFVCNSPYSVIDGDGVPHDAEAGKDANIGKISVTESTRNTQLKFKTRDGSKTKMKIIFTPFLLQTNKEGLNL